MFSGLYSWLQNLAYYLILVTAVLQILPGKDYEKYVRFFCGLLLILLLAAPIRELFGVSDSFRTYYERAQYEQAVREMEEAARYLTEAGETEKEALEE